MNEKEIKDALAPLQPFLDDTTVVEIMVDGFDKVYVERQGEQGQYEDIPSPFRDNRHLLDVIHKTAVALDHKLGEGEFMMDVRLPDGARFNVVLPPIAILGPSLVIRKFSARQLTVEDLIRYGSINQMLVDFLQMCINGRLNIVISGGTNSGKTSLLNIVTGLIPPNERIVTVENAAELRPPKALKRIVRLESQPGNASGKGIVTMRDLVTNAMRMRADRIIVGEIRSGEALNILSAMNTGHEGSMFAIHANSPRDALARLETMVYLAMSSQPLLQVRQQMASALDLIVQAERLRDGSRKVVRVSEAAGMQGDVIMVRDIFKFEETEEINGRIQGTLAATGYIPTFVKKMHMLGITVPMDMFNKA